MPIEVSEYGAITATGAASIELVRLLTLKSALGLEIKGIRIRRGYSAYATLKRELNLKGSRQTVLLKVEALIDQARCSGSLDREQ